MQNKKLFPMASNELIFFESAQNAAGGFFGESGHIGQVLVGKPNGNADALAFLNAGTLSLSSQGGQLRVVRHGPRQRLWHCLVILEADGLNN